MRRYLLVILLSVLLGACRSDAPSAELPSEPKELIMPEKTADAALSDAPKDTGVFSYSDDIYGYKNVFVSDETYVSSMYEPDGIYTGADISGDPFVTGIADFEEEAGSHAIYKTSIVLGDDYPELFALECFSLGKTPLITILPPETGVYDVKGLTDLADAAGQYDFPVFIELYPYSAERGYKRDPYQSFFSAASKIFGRFAPNAALVWSTDLKSVYTSREFYPGASNCDWIGLSMLSLINRNGAYDSHGSDFNFFYYSYQRERPLMITKYSVSHYSTLDNVHRPDASSAELDRFYSSLADYPRVKALCYSSAKYKSEMGIVNWEDDCGLNSDEEVCLAYADVISRDGFISNLGRDDGKTPGVFNSPFIAYTQDGETYLSENSLRYDLGYGTGALPMFGREIDGQPCYPVSSLGYAANARGDGAVLLEKP